MTAIPPPPPPPVIEEQSSPSQPTFMEQWLEKEKSKLPSKADSSKKLRQYFEKQCMFPRYIPSAAMCDVNPMLALLNDFDIEADDIDDPSRSAAPRQLNSTHRTAIDDIRKIASVCATYKSRALINHKEFQYKRAMKLKELKQKQEREEKMQQQQTVETFENNINSSPDNSSNINEEPDNNNMPTPPPPHPEYTPLTLPQNFLMAKIHSANYNLCLANASCPKSTRRLLSCWKSLDPKWVKYMEEQGMENYICLEEREAVERCVGLEVQRVMKDILG